ncbi:MAG: phosphoribosylanthranilate isomerase [Bacteroidota bacterium]
MKTPYFIKICGITTIEDAIIAVESGATAIGLNFYSGSKRYVDIHTAQDIADRVRRNIAVVGVFVNDPLETVKMIASAVKLTYCQFHGEESPEYVKNFPNAIKSFRINSSLQNVQFDDYRCAAFLLDAFSAKEYGGTGKTFDWMMAREANEFGKIIVAGGLNAENVRSAIEIAQPWGVDVSSGVEREAGKKDREKVIRFVQNARDAFKESQ